MTSMKKAKNPLIHAFDLLIIFVLKAMKEQLSVWSIKDSH